MTNQQYPVEVTETRRNGETWQGTSAASIVRSMYGKNALIHGGEQVGTDTYRATVVKRQWLARQQRYDGYRVLGEIIVRYYYKPDDAYGTDYVPPAGPQANL